MSGIYQVYTMIINFLGFPDGEPPGLHRASEDSEAGRRCLGPSPSHVRVVQLWP